MSGVVNSTLVPFVGLCTAHILFLSPLRELLKVDKSRTIGDLNVFPLAMISVNCFAWTGYALITNSIWIFLTNFPSVMLGLFYVTIMVRCLDLGPARLRLIRIITCGGLALDGLGLLLMIALTGADKQAARETIMGTICIVVLVIFYVVRLSLLFTGCHVTFVAPPVV